MRSYCDPALQGIHRLLRSRAWLHRSSPWLLRRDPSFAYVCKYEYFKCRIQIQIQRMHIGYLCTYKQNQERQIRHACSPKKVFGQENPDTCVCACSGSSCRSPGLIPRNLKPLSPFRGRQHSRKAVYLPRAEEQPHQLQLCASPKTERDRNRVLYIQTVTTVSWSLAPAQTGASKSYKS